MIEGMKMFQVTKIMEGVRTVFQKFMKFKVQNDPSIKDNFEIDHNNIELLLKINYGLKTFKLVLQIYNVTFFLAVFWFIYCEVIDDYLLRHPEGDEFLQKPADFLQEYDLVVDGTGYDFNHEY
jgi:hypothetical protein